MVEEIGKLIREARRKKKYTIMLLADEVGMSATSLVRVENGERIPTKDVLEKISSILSLNIDLDQYEREVREYRASHKELKPYELFNKVDNVIKELTMAELSEEDTKLVITLIRQLAEKKEKN